MRLPLPGAHSNETTRALAMQPKTAKWLSGKKVAAFQQAGSRPAAIAICATLPSEQNLAPAQEGAKKKKIARPTNWTRLAVYFVGACFVLTVLLKVHPFITYSSACCSPSR